MFNFCFQQRAQFNTRKFVVKIFEDVYNDEARVKTTVVRQEAMDPVKESQVSHHDPILQYFHIH